MITLPPPRKKPSSDDLVEAFFAEINSHCGLTPDMLDNWTSEQRAHFMTTVRALLLEVAADQSGVLAKNKNSYLHYGSLIATKLLSIKDIEETAAGINILEIAKKAVKSTGIGSDRSPDF